MGVNITSNQINDDNNSDRRSIDDQNNSPRRSITPSTPGDKFSTKVSDYFFINLTFLYLKKYKDMNERLLNKYVIIIMIYLIIIFYNFSDQIILLLNLFIFLNIHKSSHNLNIR